MSHRPTSSLPPFFIMTSFVGQEDVIIKNGCEKQVCMMQDYSCDGRTTFQRSHKDTSLILYLDSMIHVLRSN